VKRREFITALCGAAAVWPLAARAQQPALPVIGYLSSGTPAGFAPLVDAFRQGLKESGYVEARDVAIEFRWSEGQDERLPALVGELIRQHAAVIVATGGSAPAVAAKSATATVPIVFTGGQDPVKLGLAESLGRPGGNATGVLNIAPALTTKRLELLRELAAKPELIAVLKTTGMGADDQVADLEPAAAKIGQKIQIFNVNGESEFDASFADVARARAGALYVLADPYFTSRAARLVALAGQYTLPASYSFRRFAVAGGLMSYGANLPDQHRQAGIYTGRILKGEKPANLPVLQPTKFELVINLKTAKALGITIPQTLLATADEVIE
jgi:putative tryptophan/tyrosine transport system substrate-binding protein